MGVRAWAARVVQGAIVKRLRVFISGPYTKGDVAQNVRAAIEAADLLLAQGYDPYVPHLTHFWHLLYPHDYEQWIALDLKWLSLCDLVVRLSGESVGADGETAEANRLGIPVVSLEDAMMGVVTR